MARTRRTSEKKYILNNGSTMRVTIQWFEEFGYPSTPKIITGCWIDGERSAVGLAYDFIQKQNLRMP
jgi:hypothetical protein